MKYIKDTEKIHVPDILKLLCLTNDLFNNAIVLNSMYRKLFLILLECVSLKDTSINTTDNFNTFIKLKIKSGELNEEMKYLNDISWRDKSMLTLMKVKENGNLL